MKGLFKYGAIASVFLLPAGSAAFAQSTYYNPNSSSDSYQGSGWNRGSSDWNRSGWNQGSGGGQGWNQGGGWNQGSGGSQGWNQGGNWNQRGFSGSSQGNQSGNKEPTQNEAYQELSKYGYNNVRNLQRSEGWEAHATKNGDRVHVFIDDDGMIATYHGD